MLISKVSQASGKKNEMDLDITAEEYSFFLKTPKSQRPLIQVMFPSLDAEEREFLMSGITPTEWDELFAEGEE